MPSRAELLNTLEQCDTPTLEKLVKYANTVFIPDPDVLTKVTMTDMVDKGHELAAIYMPEWTDHSKADIGEILLEFAALFSEKDYVYLNMFANEGTMFKAQAYAQVYYHAIRLGYVPVRAMSSSAQFRLTVTSNPTPTVIPIGGITIGFSGKNLLATNVEPINVPSGTNNIVVTLYTGTFNQIDTAFNGQSVRWIGQDIDYRYTFLYVNTEQWTRVDNFGNSNETSKNFMLYPTSGQDTEAVFGRGGYGMRPTLGALVSVQYLTCPYTDIYLPITAASVVKNMQGSYITSVTMLSAFSGGSKAENIESIRNKATMLFRNGGKYVIRGDNDAIVYLESRPDIRKATAFMFERQLYFTVIPEDGNPASPTFLTSLETDMTPKAVQGFLVTGSPTSYVTLTEITATAYIYSDYGTDVVEQQIRDYFNFMTDPMQGAEYGEGIDIGDTSKRIVELIAGVSNFVFNTINGATAVDVVLSSLQIFNVINDSNLHLVIQRVS